MNKAIIFDFDGTIADSLEAVLQVFNEMAPEFGLQEISTEELPGLRHLSLTELLKKLDIRSRHAPLILARGRKIFHQRIDILKPCRGVVEQIPRLREKSEHFGILTSNSVENVESFLRKQGLRQHFDFISTCSKLKGKAKYLRGIAHTFSLAPDEMIYVGDEVRDIKAGHKAKVPVAAVCWGFNSTEALSKAEPKWLLPDPAQMPHLLKK